jgi:hypothetical protein
MEQSTFPALRAAAALAYMFPVPSRRQKEIPEKISRPTGPCRNTEECHDLGTTSWWISSGVFVSVTESIIIFAFNTESAIASFTGQKINTLTDTTSSRQTSQKASEI